MPLACHNLEIDLWQQTHNARYQNSVINLVLHATYVDVHSLNIRLSCLKDSDFFFFILNHHMHTHTCSWDDSTQCQWACMGRYVCTLTTKSCWSFFILPSELESRMRDRRGWLPLSLPVSTSAHRTLLLNKCGRKEEETSPNPTFHKEATPSKCIIIYVTLPPKWVTSWQFVLGQACGEALALEKKEEQCRPPKYEYDSLTNEHAIFISLPQRPLPSSSNCQNPCSPVWLWIFCRMDMATGMGCGKTSTKWAGRWALFVWVSWLNNGRLKHSHFSVKNCFQIQTLSSAHSHFSVKNCFQIQTVISILSTVGNAGQTQTRKDEIHTHCQLHDKTSINILQSPWQERHNHIWPTPWQDKHIANSTTRQTQSHCQLHDKMDISTLSTSTQTENKFLMASQPCQLYQGESSPRQARHKHIFNSMTRQI